MKIGNTRILVLLALTVATAASGQDFPSKPLRFIVPFPPGGALDALARTLSAPVARSLAQNVIVENRPGGNSVIAGELTMRAPADGHTLLLTAPSFTINPFVRSKLSFDVAKDFTPVTLVANSPLLIAIHPSLPARDVKELVALARAHPGKLTYATSAVVGAQRIAVERLKDLAKIDIVNVPYTGGAPATIATVGGHTTMLIANVIDPAPQVRAGKLRGIAVTTLQRSEVLPQVPTMAESGYPDFDAGTWFCAFVRTGTPRAAIEHLNREIARALELPEVREALARHGMSSAATTPEKSAVFIRSDMDRNARIIARLNLKMD